MLSKKDSHNLKKKKRENKFENKSENASHTGFIWIKKNTKWSKYDKEEL